MACTFASLLLHDEGIELNNGNLEKSHRCCWCQSGPILANVVRPSSTRKRSRKLLECVKWISPSSTSRYWWWQCRRGSSKGGRKTRRRGGGRRRHGSWCPFWVSG